MRTNRYRGVVTGAILTGVVVAACSDATSPLTTDDGHERARASLTWIGPAGGEVEPGKLKVCKVWDGPSGGSVTVRAAFFDNLANGTLSVVPGPYRVPANSCMVIATSTEPFAMDELDDLAEDSRPDMQRVSVKRFRESGEVPYERGMIVGFNAQFGTTFVFTNRLTAPPGGEVEPGKLKVCKRWDGSSGGMATVTAFWFDNFANGTLFPLPGPYNIPANGCAVIATSSEAFAMDEATLSEIRLPGTERVSVARFSSTGQPVPYESGMIIGFNSQYGTTILYTNRLLAEPPLTGCANSALWWRTKGSGSIVSGIDARGADAQRLIFAATPGKTGGVTWDGTRDVLDLYQELLAALNNLSGNSDAGPAAVDAAIAGALAITAGFASNIDLIGNPTRGEIGNLIEVLSAFNRGKYEGWPRCGH